MKEFKIFLINDNTGNKNVTSIGKKGLLLIEIDKIGIPIPYGFIISSNTIRRALMNGKVSFDSLNNILREGIYTLEKLTGKKFGKVHNPLLVSVRISSPYLILNLPQAILNVGINKKIAFSETNNPSHSKFLLEIYTRFIYQFSNIILRIPTQLFKKIFEKHSIFYNNFTSLSIETLKKLIGDLLKAVKDFTLKEFPSNPYEQLRLILKYFIEMPNHCWIKQYCKRNNFDYSNNIAFIIQTMVFGNFNENSGCGYIHSRNLSNEFKDFQGFYLPNSQGIELISGDRIPYKISSFFEKEPKVYQDLKKYSLILERHFKSPLIISFIIENENLYILKTSKPIYSKPCLFKTIVQMVKEGIFEKDEAILMIPDKIIKSLSYAKIDLMKKRLENIANAISISSKIVSGRLVLIENIINRDYENDPKILIKETIKLEDINDIRKVNGIIALNASSTSHAIIILKSLDKCCLIEPSLTTIDYNDHKIIFGEKEVQIGEWITLDGINGSILTGKFEYNSVEQIPEMDLICSWADSIRKIHIMANIDGLDSARLANKYGADGIGLVRVENFFYTHKYIRLLNSMLLEQSHEKKELVLKRIGRILEKNIKEILIEMNGKPVIIRTLDLPLYNILPKSEEEILNLSKKMNLEISTLKQKILSLIVTNPALGLKGCRLSILNPYIIEIQAKSIFKAVIKVLKKGIKVNFSILFPFVMNSKEFNFLSKIFSGIAKEYKAENNINLKYNIGIMIELPCIALMIDQIVRDLDFISFGTNDLTQLTFGLDRDDSSQLITYYLENGILEKNPYKFLENTALAKLIDITISNAINLNKKLKIGVCGEHASYIENHNFFINKRINYISCSPQHIITSRLSLAKRTICNSKHEIYDLTRIPYQSTINLFSYWCIESLNNSLFIKDIKSTQEIALLWAQSICNIYDIEFSNVWKFFKRNLVNKWFGKNEYKRFQPGWKIEDIFKYCENFPNETLRVSLFPEDIACHARSHRLPKNNRDQCRNILSNFDNRFSIEVFPESPPTDMCFRAYNSVSEFYIEASIGQAMYVFEEEQGKHPIVFARLSNNRYNFLNRYYSHPNKLKFKEIETTLKRFIKLHSEDILIHCNLLRKALGIDFFSIEGYFDKKTPDKLKIVDIDLPFDIAFI